MGKGQDGRRVQTKRKASMEKLKCVSVCAWKSVYNNNNNKTEKRVEIM